MSLVGASSTASRPWVVDSRRLHMSKHEALTSKGPPSWAKVFNRARAEKPGVCNQITESQVQSGQSQAFQEHSATTQLGTYVDTWNQSCVPNIIAEPHTQESRLGRKAEHFPPWLHAELGLEDTNTQKGGVPPQLAGTPTMDVLTWQSVHTVV